MAGAGLLAWCPDASCLVVTDSPGEEKPDALFVVSVETGEKRQLTNPRPPVVGDTSPAISPDGRSLVFRRTVSYSIGELYRLPLAEGMTAAGEPERRTTAAFNADYPAWLPGGKGIRVVRAGEPVEGRGLRRRPAGPASLRRRGWVLAIGVAGATRQAVAARLCAQLHRRHDLAARYARSGRTRVVSADPGHLLDPLRGPPKLLARRPSRRVHVHAFGIVGIWDGRPRWGHAVKLTSMDATNTGGPSWSPGGQSIVFGSDQPGQFDLYVIAAAGGKPRRLTSHPAFDQSAIFSRDGKWLYFTSNRTGAFEIWRMPASGGDAIQITRNGGWIASEARTAPTSTTSTFRWRRNPSGGCPRGGPPVKVVDGVVGWFFRAGEKGIHYADRPADRTRLRFHDFATGRSTTVFENLGNIGFTPGVSPDGRTILYSQIDSTVEDLMLVENFR